MKSRSLSALLPAILLAGCAEPAPEIEKTPPTEQKVVMVPAVGGGAQQPTQGQPGASNTPVPNPNSTPDTKQPGDK